MKILSKTTWEEIIKWCIIIAFAGLVYYIVTPKYTYQGDNGSFRVNKVTSELEKLGADENYNFFYKKQKNR